MALIGQHTKDEITAQFAAHVSSGKVEFFSKAEIDFIIGKREGIYIWDLDGTRLINCHSNGGVFNLGTPPSAGHCGFKTCAGGAGHWQPPFRQRGARLVGSTLGIPDSWRLEPGDIWRLGRRGDRYGAQDRTGFTRKRLE